MKKCIKILMPLSTTLMSISIVGFTPFAITSCQKKHSDNIPTSYLLIKNTILGGFNDNYKKASQVGNHHTLMIPQDVTGLSPNSFTPDLTQDYDAPTVIHTIKYETGCLVENFASGINPHVSTNFNNLPELTSVYFPPKYTGYHDVLLFTQCPKISLLDFSNASNDLRTTNIPRWIAWSDLAQTGQIIFNQNISDAHVISIKEQLETAGKTWELIKLNN